MPSAHRSQSSLRRVAIASNAPFDDEAALPEPVRQRHRTLTFLALAILVGASAIVGWLTWELRSVQITQAQAQQISLADRGATILAKDIDVNALLIETIRVALQNPAVERLDEVAQHGVLFDGISHINSTGEILVTDATGRIVQSLNHHAATQFAIGERRSFAAQRDDAGSGLQVFGPYDNPITGEETIILSRRRQDSAGEFIGIIQASIRISSLRTLLGDSEAGPKRSVTVVRIGGKILAAASGNVVIPYGADSPSQELLAAMTVARSGTYNVPVRTTASVSALSSSDHVDRLYAYRALDNAPLVVTVGSTMSDVLTSWTRMVWLTGLGVVLLDTAAIGLFLAMRRELRHRRLAERHARMAEQRLRLKIETIHDHAFFSLDPRGRVATWNRGAQAIMGYRRDDILGRPLSLMLVSPDASQAEPEAVTVSQAVGRWEAEAECRRMDGTVFAAIVVLSAILEPDEALVGHAVVIHDLSSQRQLERRIRMMERMDAIGQVTAGVAHDFNNLLQAQIMSLELLQERMDPTSVERELSDVALNAAEQAARLTDQLLAFSRQQMLRPSRVNLSELLVSVISLAQHTAGPNIRLSPVVARGLPAILVDSALLQTALLNLIINARDAIDVRGAITLHAYPADMSIHPPGGIASESGFVVLAVVDSGRGMDQATAERACEPFFTTKGAKGSGLGLSMVQGFARQSGGDIRIISMRDRGSTVEIWLPCAPDTAETPTEPVFRTPPRAGHILLVDDAPDVLLVLAAFLRGAGFAVTQASNAREALWHLHRGTRFTMMVSDFLMPGMDGLDLAHQARQSRPDLSVLIISGFAHSERLTDLPSGFALLRKPFRKEDLLASVSNLLPERPASPVESSDRVGALPDVIGMPDPSPAAASSGSAGPLDAGAVVEPSSWAASSHSPERLQKPTSA